MDEQTVTDSPADRLASFFSAPEEQREAPAAEAEPAEEATQEPEVQEEPDGEDFEVEGDVYKLPTKLAATVKEWKSGYMRQDDYTRKTQETAAISRQIAAIAETAQTNEQFEKQIAPQKKELAYIEHQLDQYKKVDWMSLEAGQHLALRSQMEQLKDRANEIQSDISEKSESLKAFREQKRREVLTEGQKYLAQAVKGWGPESVKAATLAAKESGYSDEEIGGILDARFVRVLWEASQYRKVQAQKPGAIATAQKAPPVVKPGAVSNNPSATRAKALAQMHKQKGTVDTAAALFKTYFKEKP